MDRHEPSFRLLTVAEVADALRVSQSKVHELARSGKLIYHRIGGVRFRHDDLETFLESSRVAFEDSPRINGRFKSRHFS